MNNLIGASCPICAFPIINLPMGGPFGDLTPNSDITHSCDRCGRGFVKIDNELLTIEQYLDPDNLLDLENYEGFSPRFQELLSREPNFRNMANNFNPMQPMVFSTGRYRAWEEHTGVCQQKDNLEEGFYSYMMFLHDVPYNPAFWRNIARTTSHLYLFSVSNRALSFARKLEPQAAYLNQIKSLIQSNQKSRDDSYPTASTEKEYISIGLNRIGIFDQECGMAPRALTRYKQAVEIDRENFSAWSNLGSLYIRMKENTLALKALNTALSLNPDNPMIYYNLSNCYTMANDLPKAIEFIKKALALFPNNQRMQTKLLQTEIMMESGKFDPDLFANGQIMVHIEERKVVILPERPSHL